MNLQELKIEYPNLEISVIDEVQRDEYEYAGLITDGRINYTAADRRIHQKLDKLNKG